MLNTRIHTTYHTNNALVLIVSETICKNINLISWKHSLCDVRQRLFISSNLHSIIVYFDQDIYLVGNKKIVQTSNKDCGFTVAL